MRLATRLVLAISCALPASAGETVDPSTFLPKDAVATLRLADVQRSRERWAASPLAALLDSGWGKKLLAGLAETLGGGAGKPPVDLAELFAHSRQLVLGVALADGKPDIRLAMTTVGDAASLRALSKATLSVETPMADGATAWLGAAGQITQIGDLFVFKPTPAQGGAVAPPVAESPATPALDPASCLEVGLDLVRVMAAIAAFNPGAPAVPANSPRLDVSLRLDPIGMRERIVIPHSAEQRAQLAGLVLPLADPAVLAALPASTLFAFAMRSDRAISDRMLDVLGVDPAKNPGIVQLDAALGQIGLPPYRELMRAVDGDSVLYVEESAPFPVFTLALGVEAVIGRQILDRIATSANLAANPDGSRSGLLGLVTMHAGYLGKQLVLTTNPLGLTGWSDRKPGFADHPEIKQAFKELPKDALAIGVSRSGASWGGLAQLALIPLAQLGMPELNSLPRDLRQAGRFGFISYRNTGEAFHIDAGGLFGGPVGCYASLAGGGLAAFSAFMQKMGRPDAAPAPVKPKPKAGGEDLLF